MWIGLAHSRQYRHKAELFRGEVSVDRLSSFKAVQTTKLSCFGGKVSVDRLSSFKAVQTTKLSCFGGSECG